MCHAPAFILRSIACAHLVVTAFCRKLELVFAATISLEFIIVIAQEASVITIETFISITHMTIATMQE